MKTLLIAAASVVLVNIFISFPVLALEERREVAPDLYEKVVREVRLSAGLPVVAFCEAGDTALEGYCDGANQALPLLRPHSVDFVGVPEPALHEIHLQQAMLKEADRAGSSCEALVVHPEQILRVNAHVVCRRSAAKRG